MPEYTITLDDVQAYLDSKADDEIVGYTCHAQRCLLTNAVRYKYPQAQSVSTALAAVAIDGVDVPLNASMHNLYARFDDMHRNDYEVPITKRQWLAVHGIAQASTPESEGGNG